MLNDTGRINNSDIYSLFTYFGWPKQDTVEGLGAVAREPDRFLHLIL